jgi:hypothetical protein
VKAEQNVLNAKTILFVSQETGKFQKQIQKVIREITFANTKIAS